MWRPTPSRTAWSCHRSISHPASLTRLAINHGITDSIQSSRHVNPLGTSVRSMRICLGIPAVCFSTTCPRLDRMTRESLSIRPAIGPLLPFSSRPAATFFMSAVSQGLDRSANGTRGMKGTASWTPLGARRDGTEVFPRRMDPHHPSPLLAATAPKCRPVDVDEQ
jgi:hypothetical protein